MPRHGGSGQRRVDRTAGVRAPIGQLPDDRQPDGVGQRMQDGHQTDVPGARVMVAQHGTMFAPDARIEPASGPAVQGRTAIREFFHDFFARNVETRHLWLTRPRKDAPGDGGVGTHGGRGVVDWAVAVRRSSGELIALAGTDTADLTPDGRIVRLRVMARP